MPNNPKDGSAGTNQVRLEQGELIDLITGILQKYSEAESSNKFSRTQLATDTSAMKKQLVELQKILGELENPQKSWTDEELKRVRENLRDIIEDFKGVGLAGAIVLFYNEFLQRLSSERKRREEEKVFEEEKAEKKRTENTEPMQGQVTKSSPISEGSGPLATPVLTSKIETVQPTSQSNSDVSESQTLNVQKNDQVVPVATEPEAAKPIPNTETTDEKNKKEAQYQATYAVAGAAADLPSVGKGAETEVATAAAANVPKTGKETETEAEGSEFISLTSAFVSASQTLKRQSSRGPGLKETTAIEESRVTPFTPAASDVDYKALREQLADFIHTAKEYQRKYKDRFEEMNARLKAYDEAAEKDHDILNRCASWIKACTKYETFLVEKSNEMGALTAMQKKYTGAFDDSKKNLDTALDDFNRMQKELSEHVIFMGEGFISSNQGWHEGKGKEFDTLFNRGKLAFEEQCKILNISPQPDKTTGKTFIFGKKAIKMKAIDIAGKGTCDTESDYANLSSASMDYVKTKLANHDKEFQQIYKGVLYKENNKENNPNTIVVKIPGSGEVERSFGKKKDEKKGHANITIKGNPPGDRAFIIALQTSKDFAPLSIEKPNAIDAMDIKLLFKMAAVSKITGVSVEYRAYKKELEGKFSEDPGYLALKALESKTSEEIRDFLKKKSGLFQTEKPGASLDDLFYTLGGREEPQHPTPTNPPGAPTGVILQESPKRPH